MKFKSTLVVVYWLGLYCPIGRIRVLLYKYEIHEDLRSSQEIILHFHPKKFPNWASNLGKTGKGFRKCSGQLLETLCGCKVYFVI